MFQFCHIQCVHSYLIKCREAVLWISTNLLKISLKELKNTQDNTGACNLGIMVCNGNHGFFFAELGIVFVLRVPGSSMGQKSQFLNIKKASQIFEPSAHGRSGWCSAKYIGKLIFYENYPLWWRIGSQLFRHSTWPSESRLKDSEQVQLEQPIVHLLPQFCAFPWFWKI